jgi:endonuclease/exonuclease/phosphatase family metal-dependent hydrolase
MKFLTLLYAFIFSFSAVQAADDLRVMSFNLRYINPGDRAEKTWVARRDQVAAVMKADRADFIGVQEAFRSMLDDVKARLPEFAEVGVGRENGKEKGEYSAILYRSANWEMLDGGTFWLSDTPDVPGSAHWGNSVVRICTWGQFRHRTERREVLLYNTHFDHESQPCREKGAALIVRKISEQGGSLPVVVMGDLNAAPDNPAIACFTAATPRLIDVWAALRPHVPAQESGTFHGFHGNTDGARIDYIFASEQLRAKDVEIVRANEKGVYPSDHYPVRATFTWKE